MPDPAPNEPKPEKPIIPEVLPPTNEKAPSTEFDPLAFWIQYRGLIKRVVAVVLIGAATWGGYELMQYRKRSGSEQAFAAAKNPDDLRKVIAEWEGTPSAGSAHVMLGSELRAKGNYDDSAKVLTDFAAKYPTHPLIPESIVSLGITYESAGKLDQAIEAYKRASAYPASPLAPAAAVFQARVLIAQKKNDEARKILTDTQQKYKSSAFVQSIGAELQRDLDNPNSKLTGGKPRPVQPPPRPAPTPGAGFPGGLPPGFKLPEGLKLEGGAPTLTPVPPTPTVPPTPAVPPAVPAAPDAKPAPPATPAAPAPATPATPPAAAPAPVTPAPAPATPPPATPAAPKEPAPAAPTAPAPAAPATPATPAPATPATPTPEKPAPAEGQPK